MWRLALILHEAGLRRAGEVRAMTGEQRALALAVLDAGLGRARGTSGASERTWAGVASMVGYLGGGSGGRRTVRQSRAGLGSTMDERK